MGQLESESRARTRRKNLQRYILEAVSVAGLLSVALLAPNVAGTLKKLNLLPGQRQNELIKRSRERLIKKGWLQFRNGSLEMTPSGEVALMKMRFENNTHVKPKWDKKWRILIFDIPERRKSLREKVRATLTSIGFLRLQDSVWVYPYDCEDFMTLLKADFKVGKDLIYIIADAIENDVHRRRNFGLDS